MMAAHREWGRVFFLIFHIFSIFRYFQYKLEARYKVPSFCAAEGGLVRSPVISRGLGLPKVPSFSPRFGAFLYLASNLSVTGPP
jgi:hypothetical protein